MIIGCQSDLFGSEEGGNIDQNIYFNNFTDLDVFTWQFAGNSIQEKNGLDSTFPGDEEGDPSPESRTSQSANCLNDEESLSDGDAGDENIDFPVEDRLTGDENHLIYIGIRICNIKKNFMT